MTHEQGRFAKRFPLSEMILSKQDLKNGAKSQFLRDLPNFFPFTPLDRIPYLVHPYLPVHPRRSLWANSSLGFLGRAEVNTRGGEILILALSGKIKTCQEAVVSGFGTLLLRKFHRKNSVGP